MRPLTRSEKILLTACAATIALTGLWLADDALGRRRAAARNTIENLGPRSAAAVAAASDAPFWTERQQWLDATMPTIDDQGTAHSRLLEQLVTTARDRGLTTSSPVLLKPEAGPHHRDLSVTLQLTGPDQALFRWLSEIQSPEKFHVIKYLLLTPATAAVPPRMNATITEARFFKP
jgi:hypothetical protein